MLDFAPLFSDYPEDCENVVLRNHGCSYFFLIKIMIEIVPILVWGFYLIPLSRF